MLLPVPREHLGTQIVILERRPPSRWIIHEWYPMVPMWKKGSKWFRILGSWDILGWQSNGWYLAYNHYIHSIYPILTVLVISCQLHPITTRRLWKAGHLIAPQPINHGDLEKKIKKPNNFSTAISVSICNLITNHFARRLVLGEEGLARKNATLGQLKILKFESSSWEMPDHHLPPPKHHGPHVS